MVAEYIAGSILRHELLHCNLRTSKLVLLDPEESLSIEYFHLVRTLTIMRQKQLQLRGGNKQWWDLPGL